MLQPEYSAPVKDIVTDDNTFEITAENPHIVQQSDGKYLLVQEKEGEQYE